MPGAVLQGDGYPCQQEETAHEDLGERQNCAHGSCLRGFESIQRKTESSGHPDPLLQSERPLWRHDIYRSSLCLAFSVKGLEEGGAEHAWETLQINS